MRSIRHEDGDFVVELEDRTYEAEHVVVATGPFQVPRLPPIAANLDDDVTQMHSANYRRSDDLPPGTVLVGGGGNTGFQIAHELAATREVHLSIGTGRRRCPSASSAETRSATSRRSA